MYLFADIQSVSAFEVFT